VNTPPIYVIGKSSLARGFAGLVQARGGSRDVLHLVPSDWAIQATHRVEIDLPTDGLFVDLKTQGLQDFLLTIDSKNPHSFVFLFEALKPKDLEKLRSRLGDKAYFVRESSVVAPATLVAEFECPWRVTEKIRNHIKFSKYSSVILRGTEKKRLQRIFRQLDVDSSPEPSRPVERWNSWACQISGRA